MLNRTFEWTNNEKRSFFFTDTNGSMTPMEVDKTMGKFVLESNKVSSAFFQLWSCFYGAWFCIQWKGPAHSTAERERWNRGCFLAHLMKVRQVAQDQTTRKKLAIFIFLANFISSICFNDVSRKE